MRTDAATAPARVKKKKRRSAERSRLQDAGGEWQQFTSPDGHPYYYNAATKESRWELPVVDEKPKHRRPRSSKEIAASEPVQEAQETEKTVVKEKKQEKKQAKPKNAMFQKLQASLEGRLPMGMGGPPPVMNIRHEVEISTQETETKTQSLEEQYEAETAGMSAAERLRFLRKKRQEDMLAKRESIAGDDFMAEVANNMKKKGVVAKPKERKSTEGPSWKEQELAEEERKRQQMLAETEAKEQEAARKERERQAAAEREQLREKERKEQLALEQQRQDEREKRVEEENRQRQEDEERKKAKAKEKEDLLHSGKTEPSSDATASTVLQDDDASDVSSPERVKHRRRSRSRGSKHGSSTVSLRGVDKKRDGDIPSAVGGESSATEVVEEPVQDKKHCSHEERRARKVQDKDLTEETVTSKSRRRNSETNTVLKEVPSTRSTSSIDAEEEEKLQAKLLRRERRRIAELEAALAAQSLADPSGAHGEQHQNGHQGDPAQQRVDEKSNGSSSANASVDSAGYPMSGQPLPGQPPLSGGMYPPYPYPMMPPPPPSTYGFYYPYMQPPPMTMPMYPPSMIAMPPGYQLMPQTPPPSFDGITAPSALVPYGADGAMAASYGYGTQMDMYGQQAAPELSRCDCCKGIGVGLVEKNGVCAHCNRLRLAFIVDSAQMRQRCSVCGGWGFQFLQANGMCEHCTRQTSQAKLARVEPRHSKVAAPAAAAVPAAAPPRNASGQSNGLDDNIDWDESSSDESDWDT
ncbi:unnamed protein product [Phytophthora lilii]|uniref:Unnamed protein product n=1 Tax=Phytophthora lilii TaxID=2077276 RepID=A0A9W6WVY8_9STRA|nr:unnamed protein product [Phytophthora lilii]